MFSQSTLDGAVTTIIDGRGWVDGLAGSADLSTPRGLALDSARSILYFCDERMVRAVDLVTKRVSTIAGMWNAAGSADGFARAYARFSVPQDVAFEPVTQQLWVIDVALVGRALTCVRCRQAAVCACCVAVAVVAVGATQSRVNGCVNE